MVIYLMTILAVIGNRIQENDIINRLSDTQERHSFASNFLLLYDNNQYICRSMKSVLENSFINEGTRVLIAHLYTRIRKTYDGFTKFARLWRWYKARNASVDTDLFMNSLDSFKPSQTFRLLQAGTKYNFRITDLLKIWSMSLANCCSFHPRPQLPKNPYTNLEFNLGHLANIYLHARKLDFNIPILITLFWQNSLDMEKFRTEGYPMLKEAAVRNYMCDNSQETLFYDIINMISALDRHLSNRNVSMDLLPSIKKAFIEDMKPFLKKYLLSKHTCNPLKKRRFKREVISDLKRYFIDHPLAGRRVVYPSWRQRRNANTSRGTFSFGANTILDDSVFIFGAGRQTPVNPISDTIDGAPPLFTDDATEEEEEESYNEVLDDSDDAMDPSGAAADSDQATQTQEEAASWAERASSSESDPDEI